MLTVIVVFYNMRREAPRTLFTLSPAYQKGLWAVSYRVIALDNGSTLPLVPDSVECFGPGFSYRYVETSSRSPAAAINRAVEAANTEFVCVLVDGARMLSPGLLGNALDAFRLHRNPMVATLGWHIGDRPHYELVCLSSAWEREEQLLASVDWQSNGYRLFDISCLAGSSPGGFFGGIPAESNCFIMRRDSFLSIGGYDERFRAPGGGLANLEFFERVATDESFQLFILLGEGNFHQFHAGVSTGGHGADSHPFREFAKEYQELMGRSFRMPSCSSVKYLGSMPPEALRFLDTRQIPPDLARRGRNLK